MNEPEFIRKYEQKLADFAHMSQRIGSRTDYVQGGGGNTSVKLDNELMAIKASGYKLGQIDVDQAYAVVDYAKLRGFYNEKSGQITAGVETEGAELTRSAAVNIAGMDNLRPSVETGFHAVLDEFVLHSHSVYANLAACSHEGQQIAAQALADLPASCGFVPYVNPGVHLTLVIDRMRHEPERKGKKPEIIFMHNHGLVITGPEALYCLELHEEVNSRLASAYGTGFSGWPVINLRKAESASYSLCSDTPWLQQKLAAGSWDQADFADNALYPDQLVYLGPHIKFAGSMAEAEDLVAKEDTARAVIVRENGNVIYNCGSSEAAAIEETLCAVIFIRDTLDKQGCKVIFMSEEAKYFISGWESEKYRRKVTEL